MNHPDGIHWTVYLSGGQTAEFVATSEELELGEAIYFEHGKQTVASFKKAFVAGLVRGEDTRETRRIADQNLEYSRLARLAQFDVTRREWVK